MYTEISKSEFESILTKLGKWSVHKNDFAKETIYNLDNSILIYSSIVGDKSRDVGSDAIRVVAWDSIANLPVNSSEARVYRIETWEKNLTERINKVREDIKSMKKCNTCGAFLVERTNSKTGEKFLGCMNYRNHSKSLNTIKNNDSNTVGGTILNTNPTPIIPPADPTQTFIPSKYQIDIFGFIRNQIPHLIIEAVPGSGKTTTLVKSFSQLPYGKSVVFVAFNKHIQQELAKKAPSNVRVQTLHSLGLSAVRTAFGDVTIDEYKQRNIVTDMVNAHQVTYSYDDEHKSSVITTASKLCSMVKATLSETDIDSLNELIERYGIDTDVETSLLCELVTLSIGLAKKQTGVIDYDDMIWFPIVHNLECKKFDIVFGDELQDFSISNVELLLKSVTETGRIIAVGDPRQSCYAFRGADTEAIPNIIKRLGATKIGVETLPLSVCYRCPTSHIEMAKAILPQIESKEGAPKGTISSISYEDFYDIVKPDDMVICRNNAPLVEPAFALLKRGIKVSIRGRDIGEGLVNVVKKLKAKNIDDFYNKLMEWRTKELSRCKKNNSSPDQVYDKYDVLTIIAEGCDTTECIITKLRSIFSDNNSAITFSSIHRAKGLETNTVFFLEPSLIPSKYAERDFELVQEQNLKYIAITRSKDKLYFVSGE